VQATNEADKRSWQILTHRLGMVSAIGQGCRCNAFRLWPTFRQYIIDATEASGGVTEDVFPHLKTGLVAIAKALRNKVNDNWTEGLRLSLRRFMLVDPSNLTLSFPHRSRPRQPTEYLTSSYGTRI
jgi:hypothetical protein